jgi:hypothetical protein
MLSLGVGGILGVFFFFPGRLLSGFDHIFGYQSVLLLLYVCVFFIYSGHYSLCL